MPRIASIPRRRSLAQPLVLARSSSLSRKSPQTTKCKANTQRNRCNFAPTSTSPYFHITMNLCGDMMVDDASVSLDDVVDVVAAMQRQESTIYRRSDYLSTKRKNKNNLDLPQQDPSGVVDGAWRQRIVEWMYGVVDHCSLRRDTVAVATHYLDLCVERGAIESRQHFQLAAMTALQLAIKLYDSTIVQLNSLIKLGRGLFSEQDVIDMERTILKALQWQVHPPTSICFLRQFLRLLPSAISPVARYKIAEVTRFVSEISVCLYKFVDAPSSAVTYAGMLIAMERIEEAILPISQRQQIFHTMSTQANMDHQSPQISKILDRLHVSLEKNVSMQDLMITIDAQCRAEGHGCGVPPSPQCSPPSTPTSADSMNKRNNNTKRPIAGVHSPREVVTPQPRRA